MFEGFEMGEVIRKIQQIPLSLFGGLSDQIIWSLEMNGRYNEASTAYYV